MKYPLYLVLILLCVCVPFSSEAGFLLRKSAVAPIAVDTANAGTLSAFEKQPLDSTTVIANPQRPDWLERSVPGIASVVSGGLAWIVGIPYLIVIGLCILAIAFGMRGKRPHRKCRGLAIAGLVLGILGLVVVAAIQMGGAF